MLSKFIAPLFAFTFAATPVAAQEKPSFDIETMLQMAWETQWSEQGMPMVVSKWNKPLRVRYVGDRAEALKESTQEILDLYLGVTGLKASEVAANDETANFTIELKRQDSKATGGVACFTQNRTDANGAFASTRVVIIYEHARFCTLHEMGHAFGMWGHPLASSVMTYFGKPTKQTELDVFFLKTLYSVGVTPGDTPFKFLETALFFYLEMLSSAEEKQTIRALGEKFILDKKIEMDDFAMTNGHAPSILYRSGRANPATIEQARNAMSVLLARSYLPSNPKPDEIAYAMRYLESAAERGWVQAMWFLSTAYSGNYVPGSHTKVPANPLRYHAWASCMVAAGITGMQTSIKTFEAPLKPEEFNAVQASTKEFFDAGKCKVPPKS